MVVPYAVQTSEMFWGFVDTGFAPGAVGEGGPGWSQVWVPEGGVWVPGHTSQLGHPMGMMADLQGFSVSSGGCGGCSCMHTHGDIAAAHNSVPVWKKSALPCPHSYTACRMNLTPLPGHSQAAP